MKKTTFTLLLTLFCCWLAAQCPTGDITFSTQGQIDSFPINYPVCSEFPANVTILGDSISNLNALIGLTSIKGDLKIGQLLWGGGGLSNFFLENLKGLDSLRTVSGDLYVLNNPALGNFDGLGSLAHLGGSLEIAGNDTLSSLSALKLLDTIHGFLSIGRFAGGGPGGVPRGNLALASLEGLDNIRYIGSNLTILQNALTTMNGLNSLRSIGGNFNLSHSDSLFNLTGLSNLKTIGGNLGIGDGYSLAANSLSSLIGLDSLQLVGGNFILGYNYALSNLHGLESLKSIGGAVWLQNNDKLVSLEGLNSLSYIGANIWIYKNYSLPSLIGLENLLSIVGTLTIEDNDSLKSLFGLKNATIGTGLGIYKNNSLTQCEAESICHFLATPTGTITIGNNALGCNNKAEVEAACTVSIEETLGGEPLMLLLPNPATDFLQIQINDPEAWDISIFDFQGRQMFRQVVSGSGIISVKDWPSGIYVLRAVSGRRVFAGKVVMQ